MGIDQVDLAASSLGVLVRLPRGVGRCLDGIERTVAFGVHIHSVRQRGLGIFHTGVGTGIGTGVGNGVGNGVGTGVGTGVGSLSIRTRCIVQRGEGRGWIEGRGRALFEWTVSKSGVERLRENQRW